MKRLLTTIVLLSFVSCGSDNTAEHDSIIDIPAANGSNTTDTTPDEMKYRLIQSDVAIVNQYGEDSIIIDKDGNMAFLYPAPDTIWFNSEE